MLFLKNLIKNNLCWRGVSYLEKIRKKLAKNQALDIRKFCLSDDSVDYKLYDTSNSLGSAYYGSAITSLPQLEVVPDDSIIMRYHLLFIG